MKKLFIDTETTGLKPEHGAVLLSVAMIGDTGDEFSAVVLPTEEQWALATPEALAINGITWEFLQEHGKPLGDVEGELNLWLYDRQVSCETIWVGQNPEFDHKFLWNSMVIKPAHYLDIRAMYRNVASRRLVPALQKYSGRHIAISLGVEPEPDIHTAIEGARVVRRNHDKLVAMGADQCLQVWKDMGQWRMF